LAIVVAKFLVVRLFELVFSEKGAVLSTSTANSSRRFLNRASIIFTQNRLSAALRKPLLVAIVIMRLLAVEPPWHYLFCDMSYTTYCIGSGCDREKFKDHDVKISLFAQMSTEGEVVTIDTNRLGYLLMLTLVP
jgi:hypothetical protein